MDKTFIKNVFLSYSSKYKKKADRIERILNWYGINVVRDIVNLQYKEDIIAFMNKIREVDYRIFLLSKSFFLSKFCMYEAIISIEKSNFRETSILIFCENYKSILREKDRFIEFWTKKEKKYIKTSPNTLHIHDLDTKIFSNITKRISYFISILHNMEYISCTDLKKNNFKLMYTILEINENELIADLQRILMINKKEEQELEMEKFLFTYPRFPAGYYCAGKIAVTAGNYKKADHYFKLARNNGPYYSSQINFIYGEVYLNHKKFNDALFFFNKAVSAEPDNTLYLIKRGHVYSLLNNDKKAINDFNKAIKLDNNTSLGYAMRGLFYNKIEKHQFAKQDFEKAIKLKPDYIEAYYGLLNSYYRTGDYTRGDELFKNIENMDCDKGFLYATRGFYFFDISIYEKAIADFNIAINYDNAKLNYFLYRGVSNLKQDFYEKALSDFTKCLELCPTNIDALANRSHVYFILENYKKCIEDCTIILNEDKNCIEAYINRAAANRMEGNFKLSLSDLNIAYTLNKKESNVFYNRALVYGDMNEIEYALKDYKRCIRLSPKNIDAYYNQALLYEQCEMYFEALWNYIKILQLNPEIHEIEDRINIILEIVGGK